MSYPYNKGDILKFKVRAEDVLGNGIANANMVNRVWRDSDNQFFNLTTGLWQTNIFDIPMIPNPDTVNFPGAWALDFNTGLAVNNASDTYNNEVIDLSGNAVNGPFEIDEAIVGGWVAQLIDDMRRSLALDQDNIVVQATAISENGKMTQGDVYAYASAIQATNDGREVGPDPDQGLIYQYHIEGPLTIQGAMTTWTKTRVVI